MFSWVKSVIKRNLIGLVYIYREVENQVFRAFVTEREKQENREQELLERDLGIWEGDNI